MLGDSDSASVFVHVWFDVLSRLQTQADENRQKFDIHGVGVLWCEPLDSFVLMPFHYHSSKLLKMVSLSRLTEDQLSFAITCETLALSEHCAIVGTLKSTCQINNSLTSLFCLLVKEPTKTNR